ncbi:TetR/AcrR family transcriptional regulator, partial [Escherichia coli]|nr:TetR/AcrR family transcriptional regulator [Escherichia coli]
YEQTSLQDIALAVGVSKAAVYHYFTSKQDIYDEIVIGLLDGLLSHVKRSISDEPRAAARIAAFMRAHAEYFDRNFEGFATLLHGVGGLRAQIRSDRQIFVRDQYETLLHELLEAASKAGDIRVDDVRLAARAILSMLNWMSRWYKPGGRLSAVEIAEQYHTMLVGGISLKP